MTLELKHVTVRRNTRNILDKVSLTFQPGELTAICGPNGAGKTTAFSVMSGMTKPNAGTLTLNGRALSAYSPRDLARVRAALSQTSELAFPFQVHEVVALGRAQARAAGPTPDALVIADVIEAMDLVALADRNYLTLSGGERQRVNIARALAQVWPLGETSQQPTWLLLDEPAAALDLRHQELLFRVLRKKASEGWGIIAILHDLHQVRTHADRVILMRDARVYVDGTPAETLLPENIQAAFGLTQPYAIG